MTSSLDPEKWTNWYPSEDDPYTHVIPPTASNARQHELSRNCWCHPQPDWQEPLLLLHRHLN